MNNIIYVGQSKKYQSHSTLVDGHISSMHENSMEMDRTPFTYHICWSGINVHYYGVRYGKGCHPTDLWSTYFTSSEYVQDFIEMFGNPDILEIRRVFDSVVDAQRWENKVLRMLDAPNKSSWLNRAIPGIQESNLTGKRQYINQKTGAIRFFTKDEYEAVSNHFSPYSNLDNRAHYLSPDETLVKLFVVGTEPNGWKRQSALKGKVRYESEITGKAKFFSKSEKIPTHYKPSGATSGKRGYINSEGIVMQFRHGEQPEGWMEFCPTKGKNMYKTKDERIVWLSKGEVTDDHIIYHPSIGERQYKCVKTGVVKTFVKGLNPEGWIEYNSTTNTRQFKCPISGKIKRFKEGCEPDGWIPVSNFDGKVAYKNPSTNEVLFFEKGTQPEGWVGVLSGTQFYRNPKTKHSIRIPKTEIPPEGYFKWNSRWGYADKSIIED